MFFSNLFCSETDLNHRHMELQSNALPLSYLNMVFEYRVHILSYKQRHTNKETPQAFETLWPEEACGLKSLPKPLSLFHLEKKEKKEKRRILRIYSQSKAPLHHSYTKPRVRIARKSIIEKNPTKPTEERQIDHGKRKLTSRSKIKKRIATR